MIIRHVKYKDFDSWLWYYKVFNLSLIDDLPITEIFDKSLHNTIMRSISALS